MTILEDETGGVTISINDQARIADNVDMNSRAMKYLKYWVSQAVDLDYDSPHPEDHMENLA
jgi:hypothetical protein